MRLYPTIPSQRTATVVRDLVVLALLVLFAWLGLQVHDTVASVAVVGEGVTSVGRSVEGAFDSAAEALDGAPLVGDDIAGALRDAGAGTGGEAAELGMETEERILRLASLLGAVTFGLPALLLLLQYGPPRIALARRLTHATRVLVVADTPDEQRLVAMRAAFSLPYGQLLRHTRDPFGDLAAGRYEPLVAAAWEEAGLRAPRYPSASSSPLPDGR